MSEEKPVPDFPWAKEEEWLEHETAIRRAFPATVLSELPRSTAAEMEEDLIRKLRVLFDGLYSEEFSGAFLAKLEATLAEMRRQSLEAHFRNFRREVLLHMAACMLASMTGDRDEGRKM
jgi:hypothetical protein